MMERLAKSIPHDDVETDDAAKGLKDPIPENP